jgi:hypothetical protein
MTVTALLLLLACIGAAPAAEPGEVVRVRVRNLTAESLRDVPVTFGQVFRRGQITEGIVVRVRDKPIPAQVDIRRHHEDGSVRLAVISAVLDELPGSGETTLALGNGAAPAPQADAVSASELLKTALDTVVRLEFPDGTVRSASARKMLQESADGAQTWLRGPIATEWLLAGPPLDSAGRPDEDLHVQFQVRAYRGGKRARVSVVVENCWDRWAGNIRYDVSVSVAGSTVFSAKAVDHRPLSRWRKVFWWGEGEPGVHVVHDLGYLSCTGALPRYDTSLTLPEPTRETQRMLRMEGPDWEILGKGALTAYMPTTGGRPEIAPYPSWTVEYLLSMDDPQRKALVLAGGDLAGSWPIHVRARGTGTMLTIDQRPEFWLDERGRDRPRWKPDRHPAAASQMRLSPDLAHQSSLAYVPYLVTGDYYYMEEACFWGGYCLLATWPEPRQKARGILAGEIRGDAWALRNIADAGWIASDGDPAAAYFAEKVRNNIAQRIEQMYGPPEHNKIGAWGVRTTEDARIQNPANPNWMITAPWEEDYLLWSLHHLVELGYAEAARPRDSLLRLRVGVLTHPSDFNPLLGAPYRLVVGEKQSDGKVLFYEDWKKLGRENARLSRADLPNYGNSYAYSARAAVVCGIDGGFPKAAEALRWLEEHLPDSRAVMAREPHWAIVPGGAASKDRREPQSSLSEPAQK